MMPFWSLILLGGLLPSSQGLPILGSIFGAGDGLLGTGVGGKNGLLGTGILGRGGPSEEESGGPLAGDEASRSGVLGTGLLGEQPGSSGLLSTGTPILGGEGLGNGLLSNDILGNKNLLGKKGLLGTGILGGEGLGNGLLGNGLLSNDILGNKNLLGEKGLLGTGLLGGEGLGNGLLGDNSLLGDKGLLGQRGLLGNGSLLGLDGLLGEGGLLHGSVLHKSTPFGWLKVLNLENVRVSWKVLRGGELVLNLYSKLVLRFPEIFRFLSGSSIETNITSHIALTQDTPGDLRLVVKDCSNLLDGSRIDLRSGLFSNVVSRLLNVSLRTLVPALLCPLVNIWVSIINLKLQFLNRVISFGLLGKIYSALSNLPVTAEHSVELDLQNSPFPSAFIDWLLQTTGIDPGSIP